LLCYAKDVSQTLAYVHEAVSGHKHKQDYARGSTFDKSDPQYPLLKKH
jgi:hypothetical protein